MVRHADLTGAELHDPKGHASNLTGGTDDIQDATNGQKGLMTASLFAKLVISKKALM